MKTPRLSTWIAVAVLVLAAASVLREPLAQAAQLVDARIIGPLDRGGDVKVHEQGIAAVDVTNASLAVRQAGAPITIRFVGDDDWYTVPSTKRLVIHYVSGIRVDAYEPFSVNVLASSGGQFLHIFRFLGTSFYFGNVVRHVVSEPVLIHAGPGQRLFAPGADIELSGYLVDA